MKAMPGPDKKRPCWQCPDRTQECHGPCKEYQKYAEERRKKREFLFRYNQGHEFPACMKYKKSSGCYVVPKSTAHRH